MRYEVVQCAGAWIVRNDGVEVARFAEQDQALADVSLRLKDVGGDADVAASLAVRYERRSA